jgi:hypothetical protein
MPVVKENHFDMVLPGHLMDRYGKKLHLHTIAPYIAILSIHTVRYTVRVKKLHILFYTAGQLFRNAFVSVLKNNPGCNIQDL